MYEDDYIATSFGNYVCLPLLRKAGTDLSKEDAKKVLEDCLRVLFYRNTKSSTRVLPSSACAPSDLHPMRLAERTLRPGALGAGVACVRLKGRDSNGCAPLQIQISTVTAAGVEIAEPYDVSTYWGYDGFKHTEYHGQKRPQEVYLGR